MGENYKNSLGFGGRGNDTIHMPGQMADFGGSLLVVNGGHDADTFIPRAFEDSLEQRAVRLYGDEGDDVIAGVHKITGTSTIKGGDGMDRITSGRGITGTNVIQGNNNSDVIYGADNGNDERQFGDWTNIDITDNDSLIDQGGHDYLFGSSNLTGF